MGLVYAAMSAAVLAVLFLAESAGYRSMDPYTPMLRFVVVSAALLMTGFTIYFAAKLKEDASARALASEHQFASWSTPRPRALLTVDAEGIVRGNNPAAQTLFQFGSTRWGAPCGACPDSSASATRLTESPSVAWSSDPMAPSARSRSTCGPHLPGAEGHTRERARRHPAAGSEQDRARLTQQLNQMQKQESIGLLAGGIAA